MGKCEAGGVVVEVLGLTGGEVCVWVGGWVGGCGPWMREGGGGGWRAGCFPGGGGGGRRGRVGRWVGRVIGWGGVVAVVMCGVSFFLR